MTSSKKRCFVGYFGIDRSLNFTLHSIKTNILYVLKDNGYDVFAAAHLNLPDVINSERSGEVGIATDRYRASLLNADVLWQESQPNTSVEPLLNKMMAFSYLGCEDTKGHLRRNMLYQLHSLFRLMELARLMKANEASICILLRPDLEYLDPFPVETLQSKLDNGTDLIVPSWQSWGGLNDRFAVASFRGCLVYLTRITHAVEFAISYGYIHSESLLAYVANLHKLRIETMSVRARRIRATGAVYPERFH